VVESDDLDMRVVRALNYYRALIEAGKHTPGAAARRALRGAQQTIDDADRRAAAMPRGGLWD
jgi:hypothetical protein